jgi:hypothetical protein
VGTSLFLFGQKNPDGSAHFSLSENLFITALISIVVVNCGVLFENRAWVKWAEWTRIIFYPLLLSVLTYWNGWSFWLHGISLTYLIISFTWFYSIQRQHAQLQVA